MQKMRRTNTTLRRISQSSKAVQTEASYPPNCTDTAKHLEEFACEQFRDLVKLRDVIRDAMRELACSVYDVVAFKDVLFKMESELPSDLPMTDMLLLSSKLFRRAAELGRLLGCFFTVVFAEEHVDERFHFMELSLLRRELVDLKQRFQSAEEERLNLRRTLENVSNLAIDHSRAVDLLETRNAALQLQTNGLEDQMGLLFSQLNRDLHQQYREAYTRVTNEIDGQDRMSLTMAIFRQTMESLSDQLRRSRTLITEVRELVMSCAQATSGGRKNIDLQISKEPSIRFKLKQVENNFQQLVSRFSSVKNILSETAQELMNALQERRNILYLALQHIRIYDVQNTKMRQGRAIVLDMKQHVQELLSRMLVTFPPGVVAFVDGVGRISAQQWQVGQTLAAIRGQRGDEQPVEEKDSNVKRPASEVQQKRMSDDSVEAPQEEARVAGEDTDFRSVHGDAKAPFRTIYSIIDLSKKLHASMDCLEGSLHFENEINAFLNMLTMSLSTTPREVPENFSHLPDVETAMDRVLLQTVNSSYSGSVGAETPKFFPSFDRDPALSLSFASVESQGDMRRNTENGHISSLLEQQKKKLQAQLNELQPQFLAKVEFLRQVYGARINDLESKEINYQRKVNATAALKEKEVRKEKVKRVGVGKTRRKSTDGLNSETSQKKEDKEKLLQTRKEWNKVKASLQSEEPVREKMITELGIMSRRKSLFHGVGKRQQLISKAQEESVSSSELQ